MNKQLTTRQLFKELYRVARRFESDKYGYMLLADLKLIEGKLEPDVDTYELVGRMFCHAKLSLDTRNQCDDLIVKSDFRKLVHFEGLPF